MADERSEKSDQKLPLFYRLVLKLPTPNLDFLPESFQGIYWAIIVPIVLVFQFFVGFYLLVGFPFPTNILLALIIPAVTFVVFLRIMLERFINSWDATTAQSRFEWNIKRVAEEYIDIMEKQKSKRNKRPQSA